MKTKIMIRLNHFAFGGSVFLAVFILNCSALAQSSSHKEVLDHYQAHYNEALIFFRDGNEIVLRHCGDYTSLTTRTDCSTVGQENRVPVDQFSALLKKVFELESADTGYYKESTHDRLPGATDYVSSPNVQDKLIRLKALMTTSSSAGGDPASKVDFEKIQALLSSSSSQKGFSQINELIDQIVEREIALTGKDKNNFSKVDVFHNSKNSGGYTSHSKGDGQEFLSSNLTALYLAVRPFDAFRPECGTDELLKGVSPGTKKDLHKQKAIPAAWLENLVFSSAFAAGTSVDPQKRIENCSKIRWNQVTASTGDLTPIWKLVARKRDSSTRKFYEVWRDEETGKLWSTRLDKAYSQRDAVALSMKCSSPENLSKGNGPMMVVNCGVVEEKACQSLDGRRAIAGIKEKHFGLPTLKDLHEAIEHRLVNVIPGVGPLPLVSSSLGTWENGTYFSSAGNGYAASREQAAFVVCVGR